MNRKTLVAVLGAIAVALTASGVALAAGSGPAVTVKIKTLTRTVSQSVVHGEKGWITKGGTPRGKCRGNSAAGALDAATHGQWKAKYYPGVTGGIFVSSILGRTPKGSRYWDFVVNGKTSTKGVCQVRLHPGEKLLFKIVQ